MIPKTTTYKQFKEKKAKEDAAADAAATAAVVAQLAPGQTTLQNGYGHVAPAGHIGDEPGESSRMGINGVLSTSKLPLPVNGSPMADRTVHTSGHGHPARLMQDDVEMKDEAVS